ncbi:GumC family protein [Croceicoccus marinus]|uniref:non-specific protein-tyrosine kinase n=1 Tax=Croceicoccus marinus TaxID=450378 RepID=A0A7G6VT12_9SPHN|nr:AAA family ATPase [Croceicoccus marinus]QNE04877.1 AAA family ATPase [Croceicoccus marinus]
MDQSKADGVPNQNDLQTGKLTDLTKNYDPLPVRRDDIPPPRRVNEPAPTPRLLPDPGQILMLFRRYLKPFLAAVILTWIGIAIWLLLADKRYEAQSTVLFEQALEPVEIEGVNSPVPEDRNAIDTEIRLMKSPEMVRRVASAYAEQNAAPGSNWTEEEIEQLGNRMQGSLTIARDGMTQLVNLVSTSSDPEFAAATANLFAEQYIQSQIDMKTGSTESASTWLEDRLSSLESDALQKQAAVDRFKVANGLVSGQSGTLADQELSALNQQLAAARADLAEKEGRLRAARTQLNRGGGGADVGAALGSGTIGSLREQESAVRAELAELRPKYGPLHPMRVETENRLEEIQAGIQQEINRIISSLAAEVQTAQSRVNSLSGSRGVANSRLNVAGQAQTQLNQLEQQARAAQSVYEDFLERSSQMSAARFLQQPDARIVRQAKVPVLPVYPDYRIAIALGLILSLVAGVATIAIFKYLSRGVMTKADVERTLKVQYAGAIPNLKSSVRGMRITDRPIDYVVTHPHSLFAEAFRNLRMFLTFSGGSTSQTFAIVSALPQEGKSTTAACLARTTAMNGVRTILIDTDFRRRGASELFGFDEGADFGDLINGRCALDDALLTDPDSGLDILGVSARGTTGSMALSEKMFDLLLQELRQRYDIIVIDTPPILGIAEARLVARLADRVLLLTKWRDTSVKAAGAAIDMLESVDARLSGVALSQVDVSQYASTGQEDVFAYTKRFRGYYVG